MKKKATLILLLTILFGSLVYVYNTPKKEGRLSGAYHALQFWNDSRTYPFKNISKDALYKAFEKQKIQLNKAAGLSVDDSIKSWKNMGPDNVPGRMISLAVNPQNDKTLYAGSASGGLWRTYNAVSGANWHRVTTGFPVLGVMAIAIDAADTNTIFIGTGEVYGYQKSIGGTVIRTTRGSYGIGILKSEDGGKTWQKSLDWTAEQQRGIQCIEINPLNSNSIYAATSEGVYKSFNGGKDWIPVLNQLMAQDIVIHPQDTTKIIVSCGNLGSTGSGIYRSTDAGATWNKVTGLPAYSGKTLIEMYQSNPDIVYASVADSITSIGLYKTENFGESWTNVHQLDVQQYQGFFAHWVAIHPQDADQVIHAGVNIYKSTNGGSNLSVVGGPHVDHHNYAHDPQNPGTIYIANDGGVYRSTDFGSSYSNIGYGLVTAQFYNGFSSSWQDSLLAMGGLQDNNTVITYGSRDWVRVIGGDGCWSAINTSDDNVMYGSWQYNNILKSTNRGASFTNAVNGINQGGAAFVSPYVLAPSNPEIMYSGRRTIFRSTNGADSWSLANGGNFFDGNAFLSIAVAPENPDVVFAATAPTVKRAHVYYTNNGGGSWQNVTADLPDRYPMDIAVDPEDENTAYIVFSGYGSGHVYKTTNAGQNWTDITGWLPDVPTLSVAIDPANSDHVYVGNDLAVYFSDDGGSNWQIFSKGLPEAVIAMDLNVSPVNRKLRLATHGNGAWQRPLAYKPAILLAYSFSSIPGTILENTAVYFSGQLNNYGSQAFLETAQVSVDVFDSEENNIYHTSQDICCVEGDSKIDFSFDDPFTPAATGTYTVRYASPQDTIYNEVNVITAPGIAKSTVSKQYAAYEELSAPSTLPQGDDSQFIVNLPFDFIYDNYSYNKIQISTNGWIEFGKGPAGTLRGLSTSGQIGQIGANQNGSLAAAGRPNKTLGPWWEDLNTDNDSKGGFVSHKTLGTAPNRVFVIQYKNMRAYYSAETTTRLNFQVHLYEGSNRIEFRYGPVLKGTFAGGDIGAMIGFKDHLGGDYHFYDIAAGGGIPSSEVVTNLSPLKDWPGPDSMFVIETVVSSISDAPITEIPKTLSLEQNYPNPFNPTTTIGYTLEKSGKVTLKVFDVLGREVATLVDLEQRAGFRQAVWNGRNQNGEPAGSGLYIYVLQTGSKKLSRKMMLMK